MRALDAGLAALEPGLREKPVVIGCFAVYFVRQDGMSGNIFDGLVNLFEVLWE
jgi:hypothetical protein